MSRKKYIAAGLQLALYQAGGQTRRLLKKHLRNKMKQSVSGLFRKPRLQVKTGFSGMKHITAGAGMIKEKKAKKQKRRAKVLARLAKYALRETRYS
ncbi:MAG: hypothetical protein IJG17_00775 [Eubacterium sp.]|nr:hypothetical protein [Eubacterium sp.]